MKTTVIKIIFATILLFIYACSDDILSDPEITYSDIEWDKREYKIHKCPVVNRTGCGMDLFREVCVTEYDTTYLGDINGDGVEDYELNPLITELVNPNDSADILYMTTETDTTFNWDIKFYNEYAVVYIEWSKSWNTIANAGIFMHPETKACIVGQGVEAYENFSEEDIDWFIEADSLKTDQSFPGDSSWESCREPTTGRYILADIEEVWIQNLMIGTHIHPGHTPYQPDGPCDNPDQVNTQPVWLIKTWEGAYVKFQVPLFKGSGEDMQKCTVKWKTLRTPEN